MLRFKKRSMLGRGRRVASQGSGSGRGRARPRELLALAVELERSAVLGVGRQFYDSFAWSHRLCACLAPAGLRHRPAYRAPGAASDEEAANGSVRRRPARLRARPYGLSCCGRRCCGCRCCHNGLLHPVKLRGISRFHSGLAVVAFTMAALPSLFNVSTLRCALRGGDFSVQLGLATTLQIVVGTINWYAAALLAAYVLWLHAESHYWVSRLRDADIDLTDPQSFHGWWELRKYIMKWRVPVNTALAAYGVGCALVVSVSLTVVCVVVMLTADSGFLEELVRGRKAVEISCAQLTPLCGQRQGRVYTPAKHCPCPGCSDRVHPQRHPTRCSRLRCWDRSRGPTGELGRQSLAACRAA